MRPADDLGFGHGHAEVAWQELLHNDSQAPEGVLLIHEQQQAACNEVHTLHSHPCYLVIDSCSCFSTQLSSL